MKNPNTKPAATRRPSKRRRGQGMTEYVILVGLIAMGIVGAVTKFGKVVEKQYNSATTRLVEDVQPEIDGER